MLAYGTCAKVKTDAEIQNWAQKIVRITRLCTGHRPSGFFGRGGVRHHGVGASAARQYFTSSSGT